MIPRRAALVALVALFACAPAPGGVGAERKPPPPIAFKDAAGAIVDLSAFRGRIALVDIWATWCRPCRAEMPALDRLQDRYGPRGLTVVPIAIDYRGLPAVDAFYAELSIRNLPKYVDDTRESAKALGFEGVPSAIALDRQGREVFRIEGPLDWSGPAVAARLESLLAE